MRNEPAPSDIRHQNPRCDVAVVSICGPIREENQDAAVVLQLPEGVSAAILADGMGGHQEGRRAAEITVREVSTALRGRKNGDWSAQLRRAITTAHQTMRTAALGGGSTVVAAVVEPGAEWRLHLGHVGDSRAYLLRGQALLRLTADHSVVAQWVQEGWLSEADAFVHPERNLLSRALGQAEPLEPELAVPVPLVAGDQILLSSDGLHGALRDWEIAALLSAKGNAAELAARLVDAALSAGSDDNVSVICLEVPGISAPRSRPDEPKTAPVTEASEGAS